MATKNQKKRAVKKVAKQANKNPKIFLVLVLIVLIIGGTFAILYFTGTLDNIINKINGVKDAESTETTPQSTAQPTSSQSTGTGQVFTGDGDVQIYSIEMRDKYGDSLFIKYGDYDVLIDAGDAGDGEFVRDFVDSHISSDKNLDLLIVTHCHSDHMGGLVKVKNTDNGIKALDNVSTISNIIDFGHIRSTNLMYNSYVSLRDSYIAKGTNYYPAYESAKHLDSLSSVLNFGELSIEIIDTFNYATKTTDLPSDTDFNDYSVATLITYKTTKLFCAGDLEDVGEKSLIQNSQSTSLKDIKDSDTVMYKACHHGTDVGTANNMNTGATSNNGGNRMALLKIIKPDICFVSSAITQSDHPFPRAIATMLYFTDRLYFNGTNGTLCFNLDGMNVNVTGAGATTNYTLDGFTIDYEAEKNLVYTETTWYKNHIFNGAKSWYTGDIQNPTDKDLTEWYLAKLKTDYGG